ncbi:MAG: uncharacterized protein QOI95_2089 [Acidimicrobiaceae bacterium]|jgi:ketosteroid isomerase-like protein
MTPRGSAVANRQAVEKLYTAIEQQDAAAAAACLAEDVVVHIGGHSTLAGDHKGREAVIALGMTAIAKSEGTFNTTVIDMLSNDGYVVVHQRWTAERAGHSIDMTNFIVYRIDSSGRIAERWEYLGDLDAHDAFWE